MHILISVLGIILILVVLLEAFEAIILPRRVTRRFRLNRLFFRSSWILWSWTAKRISSPRRRDALLGFFGPLSLLFLLTLWAVGLVFGYAVLHLGLQTHLNWGGGEGPVGLGGYAYMSGVTFFTLGYGDAVPSGPVGHALAVIEAGMGFGFLALVIGYLPVIYQAFSRREANVSLLDARAGSPPSASELLRRHRHNLDELVHVLRDWEKWTADLMESHLSYSVLCYYRSQHANQSWLIALTTILDASALLIAGIKGADPRQAQLTFAVARHAVVDLAQVFIGQLEPGDCDRLPPDEFARLHAALESAGLASSLNPAFAERLAELRRMYEPHVYSLSKYLLMPLPDWVPSEERIDNWRTSAWGRVASVAAASLFQDEEDAP